MSLKKLQLVQGSRTIETQHGSFDVRGIGLEDIQVIVARYSAQIEDLYQKFAGAQSEAEAVKRLTDEEPLKVLLRELPEFCYLVIALAATPLGEEFDESTIAIAAAIGMTNQLTALEAIGSLTFEESGGVKKFVETVTRVAGLTTASVQSLKA